jgi:hypothetical protein
VYFGHLRPTRITLGTLARYLPRASVPAFSTTLTKYETWDEEAILKRTKMLMSQALKIWPHPGGHSKKKME